MEIYILKMEIFTFPHRKFSKFPENLPEFNLSRQTRSILPSSALATCQRFSKSRALTFWIIRLNPNSSQIPEKPWNLRQLTSLQSKDSNDGKAPAQLRSEENLQITVVPPTKRFILLRFLRFLHKFLVFVDFLLFKFIIPWIALIACIKTSFEYHWEPSERCHLAALETIPGPSTTAWRTRVDAASTRTRGRWERLVVRWWCRRKRQTSRCRRKLFRKSN